MEALFHPSFIVILLPRSSYPAREFFQSYPALSRRRSPRFVNAGSSPLLGPFGSRACGFLPPAEKNHKKNPTGPCPRRGGGLPYSFWPNNQEGPPCFAALSLIGSFPSSSFA